MLNETVCPHIFSFRMVVIGVIVSILLFFASGCAEKYDYPNWFTGEYCKENYTVMSSNYVNSLIIKEGGVSEEIYAYVENEIDARLYLESDNYPGPCEKIEYTLVMDFYRLYKRSVESMSISRSVLLGYTLN